MFAILYPTHLIDDVFFRDIAHLSAYLCDDIFLVVVNDSGLSFNLGQPRSPVHGLESRFVKVIHTKGKIGVTKALNLAIRELELKKIIRFDRCGRFIAEAGFFREFVVSLSGMGSNYLIPLRINKPILRILGSSRYLFLFGNPFSHGGMIISSEKELAFYDEGFKYSQDFELWIRLVFVYGYRIKLGPAFYRYHARIDGTSLRFTKEQMRYALKATKMHRKMSFIIYFSDYFMKLKCLIKVLFLK